MDIADKQAQNLLTGFFSSQSLFTKFFSAETIQNLLTGFSFDLSSDNNESECFSLI